MLTTHNPPKLAQNLKKAKNDLKQRLDILNELLNRHMFTKKAYSSNYEDWLKSCQPFHWLAEFYQIIHENVGFDVIIGNPPYVEFPSIDVPYSLSSLKSSNCGNLYGCCIERGYCIGNGKGYFSFIVPVAITCSKRMSVIIELMKKYSLNLYYANFDDRPGKLFEMIEHLRACVFISVRNVKANNTKLSICSTKYNRWYTQNRSNIFKILNFVDVTEFCSSFVIPKFSLDVECKVNRKLKSIGTLISNSYGITNTNSIFYRAAGGGYFLLIKNQKSITYINGELENVKAEKEIKIKSEISNLNVGAVVSSSLFYWNYITAVPLKPEDFKIIV